MTGVLLPLRRHFVLAFLKMSRDKNLQDFWRFCTTWFRLLPSIRHFENRRGEGPGDEVDVISLNKKWPPYILPQYHRSLTQPISTSFYLRKILKAKRLATIADKTCYTKTYQNCPPQTAVLKLHPRPRNASFHPPLSMLPFVFWKIYFRKKIQAQSNIERGNSKGREKKKQQEYEYVSQLQVYTWLSCLINSGPRFIV